MAMHFPHPHLHLRADDTSSTTTHHSSSTSPAGSSSRSLTTSSAASIAADLASTTSSPVSTSTVSATDSATTGASCITCGSTPSCNCSASQQCVLTSRTCYTCPAIQCIDNTSSTGGSSGGGSNIGAIVGPVVAVVVLGALSVIGWLWWKRRKARDLALLGFTKEAKRNTKRSSQPFQAPPTFRLPSASNQGSPRATVHNVPLDVNEGDAGRPSVDMFNLFTATGGKAAGRSLTEEGAMEDAGQNVTRRVYLGNGGNINLDTYSDRERGEGDSDRSGGSGAAGERLHRGAGDNNPFDDSRSVATSNVSYGSTNVIPIAFVPSPTNAEGAPFLTGQPSGPMSEAGSSRQGALSAQEALEEARRNAFGIGSGPMVDRAGRPIRPARSPDLDLRLRPQGGAGGSGQAPPNSYFASLDQLAQLEKDGGNVENVRNSAYTSKSLAPSFFSGQSEAPVIMMRNPVQVGMRTQAAEIVTLEDAAAAARARGPNNNLTIDVGLTEKARQAQGAKSKVVLTPTQDTRPGSALSGTSDPFGDHHAGGATPRPGTQQQHPLQQQGGNGSQDIARLQELARASGALQVPGQEGTFGSYDDHRLSYLSGQATGGISESSMAGSPTSYRFASNEHMRGGGGSESGRDSSAGHRDSVSTVGTGRYPVMAVVSEARKVMLGPSKGAAAAASPETEVLSGGSTNPTARPQTNARISTAYRDSTTSSENHHGPRESVVSSKSFADSLLGSFPIIPPNPADQPPLQPYGSATHQRMPTSTSTNTVSSMLMSGRPTVPVGSGMSDSPLKKVAAGGAGAAGLAPVSAVSPYPRSPANAPASNGSTPEPDNRVSQAGSAADEQGDATVRAGRHTMGLSVASEGLGGFDFKFN